MDAYGILWTFPITTPSVLLAHSFSVFCLKRFETASWVGFETCFFPLFFLNRSLRLRKLLADMKKTEQKSSSSLSLSCQVPPPKALPSTSKKAIIIQEPEKPSPPPSLLVEEVRGCACAWNVVRRLLMFSNLANPLRWGIDCSRFLKKIRGSGSSTRLG